MDRDKRRQAARAVVIDREPIWSVSERLDISGAAIRGVLYPMYRDNLEGRAAKLRKDGEEALWDAALMEEIAAFMKETGETEPPWWRPQPPPPPDDGEDPFARLAALADEDVAERLEREELERKSLEEARRAAQRAERRARDEEKARRALLYL